ncbi:MAG TPA: rhomboid family intramembrane serine protease [Kofleriaceae bacterium]|nr:rhomboid family intramembrane serine protease [Kofleriaceae bacterium]
MYYELALISVLIAGGYWGWYFLRHEQTRLYGFLQLAAAGLCTLGLIGNRFDKPGLGIPGAIGVGAGVCFLILGPLARGMARRFSAAERFGAAEKMLDVADILAPGSGVGDEKALLYAMREIRDGNIEQTVDALTAAKDRAPADARLAIDERIAMLYLASYRWEEAIAHAEEHLFGALPPVSETPGSHVALRRVLGIAPPVWVELLGAYGYKGDLDQAALMLARLEEVCAGRPDAGIWLHRGRLIFLALAGRVGAVQTLVEPKRSRHMKAAARQYWIAVAHERMGEVATAEAAYERARMRTRGRPRVLIDQALERLKTAKRTELGPTATEVVARVEAEPPPVVTERVRPRGPLATRTLVAVCLLAATVIAFVLDGSTDVGTLMRAGAMVRSLVADGEWWRLVSCIFIHVGGIHLIVNMIGLWFLGRLVEDLFGPSQMIAIFAVSGIAGAAASYLASPVGASAGASGAIFGLLGAVFIELSLHRKQHRVAWSRGVWGSLAVVTVAQIAIGFFYPVIDQWAHGAGLAAGAIAGILLSPNVRWPKLGLYAARAIAIVFGLLVVTSAVFVVRTSIADSLANEPLERRQSINVSVVVPVSWQRSTDGELFDPDLYIPLLAKRVPAIGTLDAQVEAYRKDEEKHATDTKGFEKVTAATDQLIPLPAEWRGSEMLASMPDPLGDHQQFRVVVAGRPHPQGVILVSLYIPETVARAAPAWFTQLLASVQ